MSERGSLAARVLLVDDRKDNLLALEAILQGLPVQTVAAHSGEEALKHLLVEDFALILLDAQMPDMDGFETARHIKRRERTRRIDIDQHRVVGHGDLADEIGMLADEVPGAGVAVDLRHLREELPGP